MVKLKVVEVVDTETGEIVPATKSMSVSWFKLMVKGSKKMAKMDMKISDYKVLFWIFGSVKYGNRVYINQKSVADELGIAKETVSRSVSRLEGLGVIVRGKRGMVGIEYKFNPEYVWCGNGRDNV